MAGTRRGVIGAAAAAVTVGVLVGCSAGRERPARPASGAEAVPLDTPAQALAWATDVYIGDVLSRDGEQQGADRLRWVVYQVRVERVLKGGLAGTVPIARQVAGEDVRGPELTVGQRYVLASRPAPEKWHTVPSAFVPPPAEEATVARWVAAAG